MQKIKICIFFIAKIKKISIKIQKNEIFDIQKLKICNFNYIYFFDILLSRKEML